MTRLANIIRGPLREPLRLLVYGQHGAGKTTLASDGPNPIVIDADNGSGHLDVARYPFRDGPGGHIPQTYEEVLCAIDDLATSEHSFKTLVIDSVDRVEALLWRYVCQQHSGKKSAINKSGRSIETIGEFGFGGGLNAALDHWRAFASTLDALRLRRSMDVVLVGHSQIKTFKSPDTDDYDRFLLRLDHRAAGFLSEWSDMVAYVAWEDGAGRLNDDDTRAKGFSTGRLLARFKRTAAYDAKARIPMPDHVEIPSTQPWQPVAVAIKTARELNPGELRKCITAELERIGDQELATAVDAAVAQAASNTSTLARYLQELRNRTTNQETN